jgi:hypothetical protein
MIKIVTISDGLSSATVPSIVDPNVSSTRKITLDSTEALTGTVTLPAAAINPENSFMSWLGVVQVYGADKDYTISGTTLTIQARLLSKLAEGDDIVLNYQ